MPTKRKGSCIPEMRKEDSALSFFFVNVISNIINIGVFSNCVLVFLQVLGPSLSNHRGFCLSWVLRERVCDR